MRDYPSLGRDLAEAQKRLDEVLERCAIRLKAFDGARSANDNFLFPGVSAPANADAADSPQDQAG